MMWLIRLSSSSSHDIINYGQWITKQVEMNSIFGFDVATRHNMCVCV